MNVLLRPTLSVSRRLRWLLLLPFVLISCEQDAYDKGEGIYSLMRADMVVARTNSQKLVDLVLTDEGERLRITKPFEVSWITTADTVFRAYLYYNKVDSTAEPISMGRVLTPAVHPDTTFKEGMKTDPVKFESAWLSTNRRFLNLSIYVVTGNNPDDKTHHTLGMAGDTVVNEADSSRVCHLRLYHDRGGMPEYYSQRLYLSVPVSESETDSLCLSVHTYGGVIQKKFGIARPSPHRSSPRR